MRRINGLHTFTRMDRRIWIGVACLALVALLGWAFSPGLQADPLSPSTPAQPGGQTIYLPLVSCVPGVCSSQVTATGTVMWDTGDPVSGAQVTVRAMDGSASASGTTDEHGRFQVSLTLAGPAYILAEVTAGLPGQPDVHSARRSATPVAAGPVDLGTLVLPDPRAAALTSPGGGVWYSTNGSVYVEDAPPEVAAMWARVYDPLTASQAFPGAFVDASGRALNSDVFLWIAAQDGNGQAVTDLASPATLRAQIPRSQWSELEDEQPGNGGIQVPIYWYDETQDAWIRKPDGRLTDAAGNPLDESDLPSIRDGSFSGTVYVEFQADHFSWWNLDKPADCGPDFSDAPDPYPVASHQTGCRAWLGPWVDEESAPEKPDRDAYDDAVFELDPLTIGVSNWDWPGLLYLNVLIDQNEDGDWADPGEWVVQNQAAAVPMGTGTLVVTSASWDGRKVMRVTLTGAPIADYTGAGTFPMGETEDYTQVPSVEIGVVVLGNGQVTGAPGDIRCDFPATRGCRAALPLGSSVTFTAQPGAGAQFQEWLAWQGNAQLPTPAACQEGNHTGPQCTLPVARNLIVIGRFDGVKVGVGAAGVHVTGQPGGMDCQNATPDSDPTGCTEGYSRNTQLVLEAQPVVPVPAAVGWWIARMDLNTALSGLPVAEVRCQEAGGGGGFYPGPRCTLTLDQDGAVYFVWAFLWSGSR